LFTSAARASLRKRNLAKPTGVDIPDYVCKDDLIRNYVELLVYQSIDWFQVPDSNGENDLKIILNCLIIFIILLNPKVTLFNPKEI